MNTEELSNLQNLFETNPNEATNESQKIILKNTTFNSFNEFVSHYSSNSHNCKCHNDFNQNKIGIHCFDCAISNDSYICMKCFMNGDHKGHHYIINKSIICKCDCGDTTKIKISGFCKEHHKISENNLNSEYSLDIELRNTLKAIFKAAFSALFKMTNEETEFISVIYEFISSFLEIGDDFCYLIIDVLTNEIDFEKILLNIFNYNFKFNEILSKICKYLIHYQPFIQFFSNITYKLVSNQFYIISVESFKNNNYVRIFNIWCSIIFGNFYEYPIQFCINEKNFNWVDFYVEICKQTKEPLKYVKDNSGKATSNLYSQKVLSSIIYASQIQPNEQTQLFFDKLFSEVLNCGTTNFKINNTIIYSSLKDDGSNTNYGFASIVSSYFYLHLFNCFKFKKNLKFDVLFEQLYKTIDISPVFDPYNEQSRLISKYLDENNQKEENQEFPIYYYESFPKGGSFFYNMPLYDSFVTLFGLENNCRIKISHLLLSEKYQTLRVKLGIITLQKILSFVCIDHPLIQKNNEPLFKAISEYNKCSEITLGITRYIPVFQLLIGLKNNKEKDDFILKEFFEYELARKIGIFDDFPNHDNNGKEVSEETIKEQYDKMVFSFLYLSILFVVERILFNFNNREFLRQQILFGLKLGINDINALSKLYDKSILDDSLNSSIFEKTLEDIINSKEDSFHNISGVIPIMQQYIILNKEISTNPNNLIKIQEYEPEETYFYNDQLFSLSTLSTITPCLNGFDTENEMASADDLKIRLKTILMTPTVLAIVYHTLKMNSSKTNICDHLAMNILILISKFINEENDIVTKNIFIKEVFHYESLTELISIFRKDMLNCEKDNQYDSSVNYIINRKSFESFLQLRIIYKDQDEKSIVDLLLEKGKIGFDTLKILGINKKDDECPDVKKEKDPISQPKLTKPKKDEILNQFQNARNTFKFNDIEEEDSEECPCSVCELNKEEEILSFPIYVYKTKLPCIFDKPPELLGISDSVSISCDDDIFLKDPIFFKNVINDKTENVLLAEIVKMSLLLIANNNFYDCDVIRKSKQTKVFLQNEKKLREEQRNKDLLSNIPKRYIAGANYILQYSICPHLIHKGCINPINNYKCPIDSNNKNGFLPCLTNLPKLVTLLDIDSLPTKVINTIKDFVEMLKSHIIESVYQKVDIFIELIKSLSGIITTYEVYLRSNCQQQYSDEMKILSRNLFLTTWYAYRIYGKPKMINRIPYSMGNDSDPSEFDVESRLTVFQLFIKKLIEDDNIEIEQIKESSFSDILNTYIKSFELKTKRNAKELLIFLRRAYLSHYFLLGNSDFNKIGNLEKPLKWSDILSFSSLFERYHIKYDHISIEDNKIIDLKPFRITNLPKEFLEFSMAPFNYPIDDISKPAYYKLLDFNLLIDYYDDLEENNQNDDIEKRKLAIFKGEIERDISFHRMNYPVTLLSLTENSSKLQTFYNDIVFTHPTFYIDENRCQDINYEKKKPLFLDQSLLDTSVDRLLSINAFNFQIE